MTTMTKPDRAWLETRIRAMIEDADDLRSDENLMLYGMDSMQVMELAMELEALGVRASFAELAETPTLDHWAALIKAGQDRAG